MTTLLQFRLWWKRGSAADRLSATIAAGIVVALAAWLLVPTTSNDSPTSEVQSGGTEGTTAAGDASDSSTQDTVAAGPGATGDSGTTGGPAVGGATTDG